jgi:hypothetical protein
METIVYSRHLLDVLGRTGGLDIAARCLPMNKETWVLTGGARPSGLLLQTPCINQRTQSFRPKLTRLRSNCIQMLLTMHFLLLSVQHHVSEHSQYLHYRQCASEVLAMTTAITVLLPTRNVSESTTAVGHRRP